jgi:4-hydroxythreonine-4-phosphate dehydrogenase
MTACPTITISIGDPAGIGPEVVVKALAGMPFARSPTDCHATTKRSRPSKPKLVRLSSLRRYTTKSAHQTIPPIGQLTADCGRAALAYVRRAAELCIRGEADAMVRTLNKEAVTLSGGSSPHGIHR